MAAAQDFALIVGEQWKYRTEIYLVTSINCDKAQLRSVSRRTNILIHSIDRLRRAFKNGNLVKIQEAPLHAQTKNIMSALKESELAELNRRLNYVRATEAELNGKLPRGETETLIKRISEEIGDKTPPCYTSLYKWRKTYRLAGESPLSLVVTRRHHKKKRLQRQPLVIQEVIEYWVNELYFIRTPCSITDVTDVILCSLDDLNHKRPISDLLPVPSKTTLYRIIVEFDKYEKDLAQLGHSAALKEQKWSRKNQLLSRLLERIECDTQEVDVFVTDEDGNVIGRPYLTIILDVHSRVVIGMDLSINPPCIEKTLRALKASLKSDRGYNGLGELYILDGGSEFAGEKLVFIMDLLGCTHIFCEPYAPDQKPHVERWYKTFNTRFSHLLKGTTFSNPNERGDYPSEEEAIYTLKELTAKIEEYVNDYHKTFHRELNTSPHQFWDKNLDALAPPKHFSEEDIQRMFWSKTTALPYGGRIGFDNLQWTGPAVPALASKTKKRVKLVVFYDISDLGQVWISHPAWPDELFPAQAVNHTYQHNLTLHMHHLVKDKLKKEAKKFDFKDAQKMRTSLILELHKANNKHARKRKARLEENHSIPKESDIFMKNQNAQKNTIERPEILFTTATIPTVDTVIEVRHDDR